MQRLREHQREGENQISSEPGFGAYQSLAQKIKVPFSRVFLLLYAVLRVRERFQNPRLSPVRTKLGLKRFPREEVGGKPRKGTPPTLAHQNRTIAIASDFDGAKSPEIPQKEGVSGSEIAARNRKSLAIFHRTLNRNAALLSLLSEIAAMSGACDGHRNPKSQKSLRFQCTKPPPHPHKGVFDPLHLGVFAGLPSNQVSHQVTYSFSQVTHSKTARGRSMKKILGPIFMLLCRYALPKRPTFSTAYCH